MQPKMLKQTIELDESLIISKELNGLKYYIETYGCQMNEYDSELVANILGNLGYSKSDKIEEADAIFLNTCAIREKAEETVHNRLNSLAYLKRQNSNLIIGVLGCMAQNLKNEILESKPFVDIILGPDSYRRLPDIIKFKNSNMDHIVDTRLSKYEVYDNLLPKRKDGITAWLSIMRGCDKFCTFCIVPFTRGRERSRSIESVVTETQNIVKKGYKEVTLLGQNVNSYKTAEGDFPILLDKLAAVEGIKRIRYMSPHPRDIDEDLLKIMVKHKNICDQIHLPLQAGSSRILKRMNRTYTKEEFLNLVDLIRDYMLGCSISTDIIVGFPGETDEDFTETMEVVSKVEFDSAYMFKFSSRPGTKAAEYTDQIPEDIKQKRLETLIEFQHKVTLIKNRKKIGTELEVLIEKVSKKSTDQWSGRTEGNTPVVFNKINKYKIGDLVKIEILDVKGMTLLGSIK
jgi:tRNA-2-methylthio-N6-dimethylallyladenosine synthase